jgi:hypothetical protein
MHASYFLILLCITADNFTCQGESTGAQKVNLPMSVMPSLKGLKPGDYRRLFPGDTSPEISPQGKVPGISPRIYIPGDKSPEISPPGMSSTVA